LRRLTYEKRCKFCLSSVLLYIIKFAVVVLFMSEYGHFVDAFQEIISSLALKCAYGTNTVSQFMISA